MSRLVTTVLLLPLMTQGLAPQARAAQAPSARDEQPALAILEPTDESYLAGIVRLRADVTPADAVTVVEFFVDGAPVCEVRVPPFQCDWNAGPAIAAHIVRVRARLRDGRRLVDSVRSRELDTLQETSGVDAVLVPVVVTDRRGRFVRNLTRDDFRVFEDGVEQEIDYFDPEDVPLDIVVAIDISTSMRESMDTLKAVMKTFLGELAPTDQVSLVAFNDRIYTMARGETDTGALQGIIDALPRPYGGTALLDALVASMELLGDRFDRKAVLVFTDGDEQTSLSALEPVERRLRESNAMVYLVMQGRGREAGRVRELLSRLTTASGGRVFSTGRIDDLHEVLRQVREDLASQYLLSYQPRATEGIGNEYRRIEVQSSDDQHRVRARDGYRLAPLR